MGLVKEEELELGAGSLGLGFGPFSGDGSKIGQHHLGWQIGGDGSLHSSRSKPEQGGGADVDGDDGGGGGGGSGGWFVTNNNDNNNNNNNNNARLNLAAYWFTAEQWRELQLQGMIYKHLVAGMPIPQEYLRELGWPIHNPAQIPAMAAQYYADRTGGAGINVGHPAAVHHLPGVAAAAAVDPEPQRCRRTDGKKWRCGNEAAPGKRYCEKHLHRSRPRSRKPVEQQQQQQFMPPHVPIVPTTNKFGITAAQEPSQVPGRKHPSPPQPPTRPVGLEAPPPSTKDEISSWNMMDRKKARSEEEGVVRLGSISNVRPEQQTMRQQHMSHDKLKSEQQWQPQPQHHQQMEQHHSYYPYPTYQDDSFFSLLNSDINSLNERHLSFANPWSTPAGGGTLSTEPADKYIDFARGYDNSRSNSLSASVSVSSAPRCVPQSSPHLSLVPGAREEGAGGLQLLNAAAGNGGGESTKPPPLWWLADTLLTSDMAPAAGTAPHQPATDDEEPGGVVSPATADNSSAAASPTGVLQRPLASISDCSSNSSEAFGLQGTGGGAEATGHLHWMIKP